MEAEGDAHRQVDGGDGLTGDVPGVEHDDVRLAQGGVRPAVRDGPGLVDPADALCVIERGNLLGMPASNPYRGFRYPAEVIQHAVWLYHCFSLSLRL